MRRGPCPSILAAAAVLIVAGTATAGVLRNATNSKTTSFDWVMFNGTGSELFIATSSDQFAGANPDHVFQIAVFNPATGTGSQLTSFNAPLTHVRHNLAVSEDGNTLAFISHGDLVPGQNGNRNSEVFVLNRTTMLLTQITNDATSSPGQVTRVALSGDGNRIAFASNSNLTGGNAQKAGQVFLVDPNGANLTQVTNSPNGTVDHLWISDAGNRIAFSHSGNVTGGNADGNDEVFSFQVGDAGPRQVTNSVTGNSTSANVSGDGNTLVWDSTANPLGTNSDGGLEVFQADWTTATITQVTNSTGTGGGRQSRQPWPTDDGSQFFFSSNQSPVTSGGIYEIFKINKNGTGLTRLTTIGQDAEHPVVSGGGERFGTWLEGGMYAATGTGTGLLKLIDRKTPEVGYPDLSTDGTKLSLEGHGNDTGNNADASLEVFFKDANGTLTQLTNLPGDRYAGRNVMDGAGTRIYYESNGNPLGTNADGSGEVFGINTNGTGLRQYTTCNGAGGIFSGYPEVSDNGALMVFTSVCNLTGGNADLGGEIFKVNPDGTGLTQLTTAPSSSPMANYVYWPRLDATGTWVTFSGNANIAAGNADGSFEVWRMKTDGTSRTQITNQPAGRDSFYPDISGDGSRVVFLSRADLIAGQNADFNGEVFVWEPTAVPVLRQLTFTTTGENATVRISRDGEWAYFISTHRYGETPSSAATYWFYRVRVDTGVIERAGGFPSEASIFFWWPAVSQDGSKAVYVTETGDPSGKNPDDYWEINLVDYSVPNAPIPSPGPGPTTTVFEVEPGAIRYDVIRGEVAALSADPTNVFLGPVICLENDSGDTNTVGFPDPDTPDPGEVFFYLFRGSKGVAAGPGSYGTGSPTKERLAGVGDCGI